MKRFLPLIACAAFLAITVTSCDSTSKIDKTDALIAYYTQQVKADAPIVFRTYANLASLDVNGFKKITEGISCTPQVSFETTLSGENTVYLKPLKPLDNNTTYEIKVPLSEGVCVLTVTTPPVTMEHSGQIMMDAGSEDTYELQGTVRSSDYVAPEKLEQSVKVKAPAGIPTNLVWRHSQDGMLHNYTLSGIASGSENQTITVSGLFNPYEYTIPAKGAFNVLYARVCYDPFSVEVVFSNRLDSKIKVKDFVTFSPKADYRYTIQANKLTLFPKQRLEGTYTLQLDGILKGKTGETLPSDWSETFEIAPMKPSISMISKGVLLPSGNNMSLLFRVVNFQKAQVRVKRIYESNILQFLQNNEINEGYGLYNLARVVADTLLVLGDPASAALKSPSNYAIKLQDIIAPEPGAIYRVEVRGREPLVTSDDDEYYESDYWFGDYQTYEQRSTNVLATNLAMIAKGNESREFTFFVNHIMTAQPLSGVNVKLYDSFNQEVGAGTTDNAGKVVIRAKEEPLVAVASQSNEKVYMKLSNNNALNTSNFDVDGKKVAGGIKAFVFGERGVWRPGDSLFVSVITTFEGMPVPADYPISAALVNPQGQTVQQQVQRNHNDGLMSFRFKTSSNDPTGRWNLNVKVGTQEIVTPIRIETVKPNRLDISWHKENEAQSWSPISRVAGSLAINWLFGAPGAGLQTVMEALLTTAPTAFPNFKAFTFSDPSRSYVRENFLMSDGISDAQGMYKYNVSFPIDASRVAGFLKAQYTTTVFEKGGNFSSRTFTDRLSPFDTYVGLYVPQEKTQWGEDYLNVDKSHTFQVVTLSPDGTPKALRRAVVQIYQMSWRWWWNAGEDGLASYFSDSSNKPIATLEVATNASGKGTFTFDWKEQREGIYFVRVLDPQGKHAAAAMYQVCDAYGSVAGASGEGATRLESALDKASYKVGETAVLTIPSSVGSRALISIEKGDKVISSFYVDGKAGQTKISIPVEASMVPNAYAFVTLIQPHGTKANDAPIRMFGVQPIMVEDPASHVTPVIETVAEMRPETDLKVTVKEAEGKPMSYVLAVVDQGLLNLTGYATPDPWTYFFSKEALGIRTWDNYDQIIGAYGGSIERSFAIGGDDQASGSLVEDAGGKRFTPVVAFLGPFSLKANKTARHTVPIPAYIGAVRVMVVATNGVGQGNAEKTVQVKQPLMVLGTLPRTVATQEEISFPVTVMALENGLGTVDVEVSVNDAFTIMGDKKQRVTLAKAGEETVFFRLKASDVAREGHVTVKAAGGKEKTQEETTLAVINPNPRVRTSLTHVVAPGETWKPTYDLAGQAGTNTAALECATIPPVNLDFRLKYLTTYPYGCVEQVTSSAFPQLYLDTFVEASQVAFSSDKHVKAALEVLPKYQLTSGAFGYWPGATDPSAWGSFYAGHFMVEAEGRGYALPEGMKDRWLRYATRYVNQTDNPGFTQAYATYVMALAGKPQLGAMNRLLESINAQTAATKWMLAAAYAAANRKDVAADLIANTSRTLEKPTWFSATFDGPERNTALVIETLVALDRSQEAFELVKQLSEKLNDRTYYMSTQSCAWALHAVSAYVRQNGAASGVDAAVTYGKQSESMKSSKAIVHKELTLSGTETQLAVSIKNNGGAPLYCVLTSEGIPAMDAVTQEPISNGIELKVAYFDDNTGISVDPATLQLGTHFTARVTIRNTRTAMNYTNLALTHRFPSAWEIRNTRLQGTEEINPAITYQNIRDDRVYSFFDLAAGKSLTIDVKLTATYGGRYFVPAITCEAMYQQEVNATLPGRWLE